MEHHMKPHWTNPWDDVVYVPIEELAGVCSNVGQSCTDTNGIRFVWTVELLLLHWRSAGDKLDAYILPRPKWLA